MQPYKSKYLFVSIFFSTGLIFTLINSSSASSTQNDPATLLQWVSDPYADNLCHGYYYEPQALGTKPPGSIFNLPTQITAKGPSTYSEHGESILTKDVEFTQPGRIAKADKAIIYRGEDGRISYIDLKGHMELREPGKLLVGPGGTIHLNQNTVESGPIAYHVYEDPTQFKHFQRAYDAWGTADKSYRDSAGIIRLWHASYTTCAPTSPIPWQVKAERIILDRKRGFGTAYNVTLNFFGAPFFYSPIYTFPIDNRRKTGFLTPDLGYSSTNGWQISLPFYLNLAPNYDLTLTPKYIQERNFQFNSLFRYLISPENEGNIYLSFLPADSWFGQYRDNTLKNPPVGISPTNLRAYLNDLNGDRELRGFFHSDQSFKFNENWTAHFNLNYVTDDYYFRDFGNTYGDIVANQLLNQVDTEYQGKHWNFIALFQGYQSLNRIDQALTNPAITQYMRLPEIDFGGEYANLAGGTNFQLSGQSVNFVYQSEYTHYLTNANRRTAAFAPTFSRPFVGSAGYFIPQLALDSTSYVAEQAVPDEIGSRPAFNASRNLPIFDIDSGFYLDRHMQLGDHPYLQTVKPRFFYLYVLYLNQNKYPNFDTQLLPFSFAKLFDINRFTSYDRLENANQISIGLTSRLLDENNFSQKFKLETGFGYYFQSPKVCLDPNNCQESTFSHISPDSHVTPIVGQITYYPREHWSTTASYAWDSKNLDRPIMLDCRLITTPIQAG